VKKDSPEPVRQGFRRADHGLALRQRSQ
jgi:hypothetical protein